MSAAGSVTWPAPRRGDATRRVRLMTLRAFFGWVVTEPGSPLQVNPAASLAAPVVELPAIRVVSDDDLRAILATCNGGTFVDLRDTAVIRVLIACGLRHGELHVLGKGSKPRVVSIGGNRTTLALSRYLRVRRTHPGTAYAALFLTTRPYREQWRLTGGGVREMLRRRSVLAGIDPIHPHALRHAWADANKRAGLSDEDLERLAGWTPPMMSRRYGRALADDRARQAHRDRMCARGEAVVGNNTGRQLIVGMQICPGRPWGAGEPMLGSADQARGARGRLAETATQIRPAAEPGRSGRWQRRVEPARWEDCGCAG